MIFERKKDVAAMQVMRSHVNDDGNRVSWERNWYPRVRRPLFGVPGTEPPPEIGEASPVMDIRHFEIGPDGRFAINPRCYRGLVNDERVLMLIAIVIVGGTIS